MTEEDKGATSGVDAPSRIPVCGSWIWLVMATGMAFNLKTAQGSFSVTSIVIVSLSFFLAIFTTWLFIKNRAKFLSESK